MPLSAAATAALRAMLDRLIPRDEFPSATDAGVDDYITRQLAGDCAADFPMIASGLAALEHEAGVRQKELTGERRGSRDEVSSPLPLRSPVQSVFAALNETQQDALLDAISRDAVKTRWPGVPSVFFNRLVELAAEGFYADPGQGGNRGEVSWKMIGYARRVPDRPSAP